MKIAIIGNGPLAQALAQRLVSAGHEVHRAARTAERPLEVDQATEGALVAAFPAAAIEATEVVILAVPGFDLGSLARDELDSLAGKIVVEFDDRPGPRPVSAPDLAALLPESQVVQVGLSAPFARAPVRPGATVSPLSPPSPETLPPTFDPADLEVAVSGGEATARATVIELCSSIGLRPLDTL
jgi:predicted dinucleotide-binding enzyme